ncbi:GNAT family N-acetyltransferase [Glaciibacter superstes]|uniref:GNAT family N-acetyltransferase n=1 Tax=Glaciibacter superstes TaxID=501023 RepID=UPI0003B6E2DE|nr:GNAT family N-acetyltransferase [Glaciibacter superstes]
MSAPYRPMALELETERLALRLWDEPDAAGYRELVGERGDPLPTLGEATKEITDARANTPARGIATLAIRPRDGGEFIGYCGLVVGRSTIEEPEIAYELLPRAHGHGYATEAARAILDAAKATGRTRLWSTVRSWNTPSFRVLEKIGFRRDRTVTDDRGELVWLVRDL